MFGRLRPTGVGFGVVLWAASLAPSLLPRSWAAQGVISGVSFAIGYGVGVVVGGAVRMLVDALQPRGREQLPRVPPRERRLALGAAGVLGVGWIVVAFARQNQQRTLVDMAHESPATVLPALLTTALVAAVLIGAVRVVNYPIRSFDLWFARKTSRPIATAVATVVVVLVFVVFLPDVAGRAFVDWANDNFGALDQGTPAGVHQPLTDNVSGSPHSLAPWATLGAMGRQFAGTAPTAEQIQEYVGPARTAQAPVRVYVGLDSADSVEARAELAVKELVRAGGFDRAVLCVATVTGTGWVDPAASRALEYMWAGDTATVAMQYSFFPSWISFLVDADKSKAAGVALNDAVYDHWSKLPLGDRPQLIVFGLSLGSFGAEAAFAGDDAGASIDNYTSRTDGVYLVGPTNTNAVWNQLEGARVDGSPSWRPRLDSPNVLFANSAAEQRGTDAWRHPRVLYAQHASDPVTWWNWRTLVQKPAWVEKPTGPDVPDTLRWFPVVTWLQTVGDLVNGFSTVPGHGHNYTDAYVNGFAAITRPPGWTAAEGARLEEFVLDGGEARTTSGNS